jgi:hypothetical protein
VAVAEVEAWELHKTIAFAEELASRSSMTLAKAERLYADREPSMPTENNYGEKRGPFVFTDHPHDQHRAERYDEAVNALLAMVAQAKRLTPSSEHLAAAVVGLDFGEAIEEDRARFPHESFTLLSALLVGHRLGDGTVEMVLMIGSDVSRRVYPQNMVLIDRDYGMVQAVPEGDLVS